MLVAYSATFIHRSGGYRPAPGEPCGATYHQDIMADPERRSAETTHASQQVHQGIELGEFRKCNRCGDHLYWPAAKGGAKAEVRHAG